MKKLTYNFEEYSKKDWLKIIEDSLKKGSIHDFSWGIDENIEGETFAHRDDLSGDLAPILYDNNNWSIGLDYSLIDSSELNKYLKTHLKFGLESTIINVNHSQIDIDKLFSDIDFKNIELIFNTRYGVDNILFLEYLKDYFEDKDIDINKLNITLRLPINRPESILELEEYCKIHFPNILFYYKTERALSKTPAKYISETFNILSSYITKSGINIEQLKWLLDKLKIHFFMNSSLLSDISTLRAFRIIWKNYLKSFGVEIVDPKIILGINHDAYTEDENNDLIIATILSMTGAITGVDSINIAPKIEDVSDMQNSMRLMLNIQNILKLESNMSIVNDALAGSYAIEDATNKIATKAWEMM